MAGGAVIMTSELPMMDIKPWNASPKEVLLVWLLENVLSQRARFKLIMIFLQAFRF